MTVTVLGAGSWGTALALVLARNGHDVRIVGRESEALGSLRLARENSRYLPGFVVPENVLVEDITEAEPGGDMCLIAVPSAAVDQILPFVSSYGLVSIASKGFAPGPLRLLSEVVGAACPGSDVVTVSGPNLAVELAQGVPTVAVAASQNPSAADTVRETLHCRTYRVYVSDDVKGVEIAGSLKNVIAIAAGMSDGLGFGDNTKGALLARGINEMARLGLAVGSRIESFMGIAGVGDLYATANSKLSRNYRVGHGLGTGRPLRSVLEEIGQVAEGVSTADIALHMASELGVDMPITDVVKQVMKGTLKPRDAVWLLMERTPKREGLLGV